MEIHLIRHTNVALPSGICYGQSDVALAPSFEEEIAAIDFSQPYDAIYTSPLYRCKQLATFFSDTPVADSRLKELNFGNWELQAWDAIPKAEIQPWYDDYIHIAPPNGENLLQMRQRVLAFLEEKFTQHSSERILLVTHAGCIRIILNFLAQEPKENLFNLEVKHGHCYATFVTEKSFENKF